MDNNSNYQLKLKPNRFSLVEISGLRHGLVAESRAGLVRTSIAYSIGLNDDKKVARARVVLDVLGSLLNDDSKKAFEIKCIFECDYDFAEPANEKVLEKFEVVKEMCTPLYHRAASLSEETAWRMGYTSVRLPLQPQHDESAAASPEVPKQATGKARAGRVPKKAHS